jgi:hypothetical protein
MIKVSGTNCKISNQSFFRVYKDGEKIAEVEVAKRKPVEHLKSLSRSKHFKSLELQLIPHGVTLSDIGLGK